jgi:hypothetical protein
MLPAGQWDSAGDDLGDGYEKMVLHGLHFKMEKV